MFLSGLMAELEPQFRDIRQRTISDLAANNQLESSVAVDRLARGDEDLQRAILGQTTAFGLADTSRALENRLRLFGTGLDTTQSATSFAQQDQALRNQFNLANYENQVARVLQQTEDKGGLFGGLTGGIGGALAGAALAPLTGGSSLLLGLGGGLLGGAAGAMGPSGTGTSLLQSGAGVFGSSLGSPTSSLSPSRALPGSTASSDPFGLLNKRSVSRFDNMALGL